MKVSINTGVVTKTVCGVDVKQNETYIAKHNGHNNNFQIFIDGKYRTVNEECFHVIEDEFFTDEMHNNIFLFQPMLGSKYACGQNLSSNYAKKLSTV
jgi:hypothetical protein